MKNIFWRLFLIPSVYGFCIWLFLLLLIPFKFIEVDISGVAWAVFVYLLICFFCSSGLFYFLNKRTSIYNIGSSIVYSRLDTLVFFVSTFVGIFGLILYVSDFSKYFGGFFGFFVTFFSDPLAIRALAAEETSFGFQISYLSWVSIYYIIFLLAKKESLSIWSRLFLICLLLIEVFLNLLFVDRTRPVILLVVCFLAFILMSFEKIKRPFRLICAVFLGPLVIFFAQAIFTGKYDSEAGLFNNFLIYVFGGFGYLSALLGDVDPSYELTRTFYPVSKAMQALGWISDVPSQILEFRDIPFTTNVGTFLEPLVSDGGLLYIFLGIPILIFSIDFFAYVSLKSKKVFGLFVWGNIILINVLGFFVPKYNSTSIYLFFLIFLFLSIGFKKISK